MANTALFNTQAASLPQVDTYNRSKAGAYALQPKHKLAQLAMTGCLNQTFYADAPEQLAEVLALVAQLDAAFVAKTAVYAAVPAT